LVLAYVTDWPSSFWITMLGGGVYLVAVLRPWLVMQRAEQRIASSGADV
jgi:hypothetical protein